MSRVLSHAKAESVEGPQRRYYARDGREGRPRLDADGHDLGAVVDLDPVRLVQVQHDGCRVAEMAAALRSASVIVTATGVRPCAG